MPATFRFLAGCVLGLVVGAVFASPTRGVPKPTSAVPTAAAGPVDPETVDALCLELDRVEALLQLERARSRILEKKVELLEDRAIILDVLAAPKGATR